MLWSTSLRIINGRKLGDLTGSVTCYEWNGCSLIDYFLTTLETFQLIKYFIVNTKTIFSDHSKITGALQINSLPKDGSVSLKLERERKRFRFVHTDQENILKAFKLPMIQTKIKELINAKFDPNPANVDHYVTELSSVFVTTMEKSLKAKKSNKLPKVRNKECRHFNKDCREAKRIVNKYRHLITKEPFSRQTREKYFISLKKLQANN